MLARLRRTLMKAGRLSCAIIDRTVGLPCTATYMQHFGSLRNVYRPIGYTPKRNCEYIDSRKAWADQLAKLASRVAARIRSGGGRVAFNASTDSLQANGRVSISFRLARWCRREKENHSSLWSIQCRARLTNGWIVAIRLGEHNEAVLDYLLLPTTRSAGPLLRFSEKTRSRHKIRRFATSNSLIRSISACVAKAESSSATKLARSSTRRTASRPKNKVDRAPLLESANKGTRQQRFHSSF